MAVTKFILASALLIVGFQEIHGHGRLMDPVSRSSAHRKGFETPPNWTDDELSCGGVGNQYQKNGGKCGPCGDNYAKPQPRANENGGVYGTGTIVRKYKKGEKITVTVDLTTNHMGHFEFSVCPLKSDKDIETEECFDKHPVKIANGDLKYPLPDHDNRDYEIEVVLPKDLTCERCTFRWHYRTGNSWGICENGKGGNGCGNQEIFRGCADVSIL